MARKWDLDNYLGFLRWTVYTIALVNPENANKMTFLSWDDAVYASGKGSRQGRWQLRIPGSRAGSSAELNSCWRLHHRPQPHSLLIIYYIAVKSPPGRGHTHDRAHAPSLCHCSLSVLTRLFVHTLLCASPGTLLHCIAIMRFTTTPGGRGQV